MSISTALLTSLASRLLERWRGDSSIDNSHLPVLDFLKPGLLQLIEFSDLMIPANLSNKAAANDELIGLAIDAIKSFQRRANILLEDGFMGNMTLNFLDLNGRCKDGEAGATGGTPIVDFNPSTGLRPPVQIFVHIDKESLPKVVRGNNQFESNDAKAMLIERAFAKWQELCNVIFRFDAEDKAHIIVFGADLPNTKTLAIADKWPLSGTLSSKLTLRFNRNHTFVRSHELGAPVFSGTAIHEIGHSLGLSHKREDGQMAGMGEIMYEFHQPKMISIDRDGVDARRVQAIWGLPPEMR